MKKAVLKELDVTRGSVAMFQLGIILILLYVISRYNYLLFHTLAEIVTVIIALAVFTVAWNSRRFLKNNYYLYIGISFLTIGLIDLIHALTYKGVGILSGASDPNIATQLWLAGRYLTATAFLVAPFFAERKLNTRLMLAICAGIAVMIFSSIFLWKNFPAAYVEGTGLTRFKIYSEYAVIGLFFLSLFIFYVKRKKFDSRAYGLLTMVLFFMIASEFMFTQYIGVYDVFNLLGHLLRIIAYYISYLAIVELGLMKPYRLLFKELKDSETEREKLFVRLQGLTREAQRRADEMDVTFNSLVEPVIICNTKGFITSANLATIESLGINPVGFCEHDIAERLSPVQAAGEESRPLSSGTLFKRALGGEIIDHAQYTYRNEEGKERFALMTAAPIRSRGEITGAVVAWHDITQEKEIEKAKDEFISLASHQLRTPLASISLSVELMLRGVCGSIPSEQRGYLTETFESAKRMTKLISNLLNVSRIQMGTFVLQTNPVNIYEIVAQIQNELSLQVGEKKLELSVNSKDNLPIIKNDESAIRMIIENIITNAVRYTPPKGKIGISIEKKGQSVLVTVRDTGCGIPKNEQDKVFTKSYRGSNAIEKSSEGAGLGLYLVNSLAEKCFIKVWFESAENEGTIFYISIPLEMPSEGPPSSR